MSVPVIASIEQIQQGPVPYLIVPVMDAQFTEPCVMYQPYSEYGDMWCAPYQYPGWYDSSRGSRPPHTKKSSKSSASGPHPPHSGAGGRGSYGYKESTSSRQSEPNVDVSVVLSGLPKMLCSEACLKAMFEQANIEDGVKSFTVKQNGQTKSGEAVVILKNKIVAQMMITHFEGLRCGQKITARYSDVEPSVYSAAIPAKKETWPTTQRQQSDNSEAESLKKDECKTSASFAEPLKHISAALTPRTMTPTSTPALTPMSTPIRSFKQRWADMNDDSDFDSDETQSTKTGPVRSFSDAMESSSNPDEI